MPVGHISICLLRARRMTAHAISRPSWPGLTRPPSQMFQWRDAGLRLHDEQPALRHDLHRRDHRFAAPRLGTSRRPPPGFTKRYKLHDLVWYEIHESIVAAIQREQTMKHWPRRWKMALIDAMNPDWDDLYPTLI